MLVLTPWVSTWNSLVSTHGTDCLIVGPGVGVTFTHWIELDVSLPLHAVAVNPVLVAFQNIIAIAKRAARPNGISIRRFWTDACLNDTVDLADAHMIRAPSTAAS